MVTKTTNHMHVLTAIENRSTEVDKADVDRIDLWKTLLALLVLR